MVKVRNMPGRYFPFANVSPMVVFCTFIRGRFGTSERRRVERILRFLGSGSDSTASSSASGVSMTGSVSRCQPSAHC